ncbi:MAG: HD domain-containing protein [Pseudomonadota bacterium]
MNTSDGAPSHTFIKDLKNGDSVFQYFELRSKELRKTRSGQDYLDLTLGDSTGTLAGKAWSDTIKKWGTDFAPGDIVRISGRVDTYRDKNQLVVDKIRKAEIEEVADVDKIFRCSKQDPDVLFKELRDTARSLESSDLAELVGEILDRHEQPIKIFPAARMVHHAYRGGLVEHMVAVKRKVEAILDLDEGINRSLALAGAILHDIGKIFELSSTGAGRSVEGRLIGHLILGVHMVREIALEMNFSDRARLLELEHILLSHHGEAEFGSPTRPFTREAVLVHFMDNLDSRLKIMDEALEAVDEQGFAAYNKWLEGRAYIGSPALPNEEEEHA